MRTTEVVVITGASAGVGRSAAHGFARRGARVALVARGREGLEAVRLEVEERGGKALVVPADVADAQAVEAAATEIEARLGPIDVWVNSAMLCVVAPVKQMTPEQFRHVTEVTYLGVVNGTLAALQRMLPRDRGAIVQVGAALARGGLVQHSAHAAAKQAVSGFTDSLRRELLHDGSRVHVTLVQLPLLDARQADRAAKGGAQEHRREPVALQPEAAARAIIFAAYDRRRDLTADWTTAPSVSTPVSTPPAPTAGARWAPLRAEQGADLLLQEGSGAEGPWAGTHRGWLAALAGAGAAGLVTAAIRSRRRHGNGHDRKRKPEL